MNKKNSEEFPIDVTEISINCSNSLYIKALKNDMTIRKKKKNIYRSSSGFDLIRF